MVCGWSWLNNALAIWIWKNWLQFATRISLHYLECKHDSLKVAVPQRCTTSKIRHPTPLRSVVHYLWQNKRGLFQLIHLHILIYSAHCIKTTVKYVYTPLPNQWNSSPLRVGVRQLERWHAWTSCTLLANRIWTSHTHIHTQRLARRPRAACMQMAGSDVSIRVQQMQTRLKGLKVCLPHFRFPFSNEHLVWSSIAN